MLSQGENNLFGINITATANLLSNRFVSQSGGIPAAGANTLGVVKYPVNSGTLAVVNVLGTSLVEAGGAIAQYATIGTDSVGRAVTWTTGAKVGLCLAATAASGDITEILLIPNVA
jgi:Uncharacterized conserved protein (DUF2190)